MTKQTHLVELGSRIREYRQKLGLSQEDLADMCSLHRTYIGGIERGERNVAFENLLIISGSLQIDIGVLVSGISIQD